MNKNISLDIFSIDTEETFNELAIEIYDYQKSNCFVYREYLTLLGKENHQPKHYTEIPFLPIQFFKNHTIIDKNYENNSPVLFESSGTTNEIRSKHYVAKPTLYIKSSSTHFIDQLGHPNTYRIMGLLPHYIEKGNSSLVFMVTELMKLSAHEDNGFFLYDFDALSQKLQSSNEPTIVFGVSYALLDFGQTYKGPSSHLTLIETGGMKGRKKEMLKSELIEELQNYFPDAKLYSEYGMTELLSQAYSKDGICYTPPAWMKVLIRESEDPFQWAQQGNSGGINIIDLANIHSCSFIATDDMGRLHTNSQFEILGRIDHSDIRGCSLMIS